MGDSDHSGSPFDSADEDDGGSSDTHATGLDEYTTEDVDESDDDSSGAAAAAGAAAGAAGAASGAGSGAGAGGAGAAGAGAGGAGIGSGSGGDSSNGDTADEENPDGDDGPEDSNEDGEHENVASQEPEPPERPDNVQEEGDNQDSDHDDNDENESDKPDDRNDRKQSEEDGNEEREEETDADEEEDEDDDDDDDDDDEETEATITQYADPWDSVAFGLYPVYYQLQEEYGDQLEIEYHLVPVREFDDPAGMAEKWGQDARKHRMPVNTDVWADDPPSSTAVANRAIKAVQEVDSESLGEYLRRLRVAAIVEGSNIEDKEMLLELAENVGVDIDEMADSWDSVHVRTSSTEMATPKTEVEVEGVTFTQTGIVHVNDLKMPLERAGLKPESLPEIEEFVDKYGPVTVGEIRQVTGLEDRESMLKELESNEGLVPVEYGQETFWTTVQ
jgi:predicted DsbA family dithiol-disulfide isomerase